MKWSHRPSCSFLTSLAAVTATTTATTTTHSTSVSFVVHRCHYYRRIRRCSTTTSESSRNNDIGSSSNQRRSRSTVPIHVPYFTYTLGTPTAGSSYSDTLYVPFTSYSQTRTLPQLRGPNFRLSPHVVAALCRVRDEELCSSISSNSTSATPKKKYAFWCQWLDTQESYQMLPPPLPESYGIPQLLVSDNTTNHSMVHRPTVDELLQEVSQWYDYHTFTTSEDRPDDASTARSNRPPKTIVIAGEGEPTLRLNDLMQFIHKLPSFLCLRRDDDINTPTSSTVQLRIMTNGLLTTEQTRDLLQCCCCHQFNESSPPQNNETTNIPPRLSSIILSVLLVTSDPVQYNNLMQPLSTPSINAPPSIHPHEMVQEFIRMVIDFVSQQQQQQLVDQDTNVLPRISLEITAIDRPDIDKEALSKLVLSLGVTSPIRWRPYFP